MATAAKFDKLGVIPMADNLDDDVASDAERRWGFKRLPCSDKLPESPDQLDEETKRCIIHNMEILKDLPSKEKVRIIEACLKGRFDYLGLGYSKLYKAHVETQKKIESNKKRERTCVVYRDDDDENEKEEITRKKKSKSEKAKKKKEEEETSKPRQLDPAELRAEFWSRIKELHGTEINFVYEKELFESDVKVNNNRLSIPLNQIYDRFLREDERAILNNKERSDKGAVPQIAVSLLGPTCKKKKGLALKRWDMEKKETGKVCSTYVLNGNWYKDVVVGEGLSMGMKVQLWSFRVKSRLWFALVNCLGV